MAPAQETVLYGELFGIPFDPGHGFAKAGEEFISPAGQPGIVELPGIVEVMLNRLEKLDRLAFHDRTSRRSSSGRVIRFTLPDL